MTKKLLYIAEAFPPGVGGSCVINQILVSNIEKYNVEVITSRKLSKSNSSRQENVIEISFDFNIFPNKLVMIGYWVAFILCFIELYILITKKRPKVIVATYPELIFLKTALIISKIKKIPIYCYLHDTIQEGTAHTKLYKEGEKVQNLVFKHSKHIFVMSQGMKELYTSKYKINTTVINHIYPEKNQFNGHPNIGQKIAFWGGGIYGINNVSLRRISSAFLEKKYKVDFATSVSKNYLIKNEYEINKIKIKYFKNRNEYLKKVSNVDILLLALNWPDETKVHSDEISTIFPTKTPEYLHAGKLIVLHSPSHYFLAKFILKYNCGVVIDSRDPKTIITMLENKLNDKKNTSLLIANCKIAALNFSKESNLSKFNSIIKA